MVCAVHSKTYLIFLVLIAIYCITIEEAYCNGASMSTLSVVGNRARKLFRSITTGSTGDVNNREEDCLVDIQKDLDQCEDAHSCAINMLENLTFDQLKSSTKIYMKFVFRVMLKEKIDLFKSPIDRCRIFAIHKYLPKNEIKALRSLKTCIDTYKLVGFWDTYSQIAAERIFFWTTQAAAISQNNTSQYSLYRDYFKEYFLENNKALDHVPGPREHCTNTCIDQINQAFGDCTIAENCFRFAFQYLVKDDLLEHAQSYAEYLHKYLQLKDRKNVEDTEFNISSMTPTNYCHKITDKYIIKEKPGQNQWNARYLACINSILEANINIDSSIELDFTPLTDEPDYNYYEMRITNEHMSDTLEVNINKNNQTFYVIADIEDREYVDLVYYNISVININLASDAYDYVQKLMDIVNFKSFNLAYSPLQYCTWIE